MEIALILLAAALLAFAFLVSRQPAEFRITRSIAINAPASAIFPQVNHLQKWHAWSPWVKLDPTAVTTFEGPAEGVGATTHWTGKKTGAGSMTVTESTPFSRIALRLDFKKPMKTTNMADFTFAPEGTATRVVWSMEGRSNFVGKAMSLLFSCEKMVGTQFERGLADLKTLAETR